MRRVGPVPKANLRVHVSKESPRVGWNSAQAMHVQWLSFEARVSAQIVTRCGRMEKVDKCTSLNGYQYHSEVFLRYMRPWPHYHLNVHLLRPRVRSSTARRSAEFGALCELKKQTRSVGTSRNTGATCYKHAYVYIYICILLYLFKT